MIRSSVVLPEPDGPSSASNSPLATFRSTLSSAANAPNFFTIFLTSIVTRILPFVQTPLENGLRHQRDQRQHRQQARRSRTTIRIDIRCRGSRPGAAWCWSRREYGPRPPTPRRTRPSPRALHSSTPYSRPHLILGKVTRKKVCRPDAPSEIAASSSCVPCSCISGISARATNGNVTKMVASAMPGTANSTWMLCACSHGPEQPCAPNSSTNTRPEITGLTENGRSISVIRKVLPRKSNFGDRPGRDHAEHQIEADRDRRDQQRQPDRGQRFRLGQRGEIGADAFGKRLTRTPRPAAARRRRSGTARASAMMTKRIGLGSVRRSSRGRC